MRAMTVSNMEYCMQHPVVVVLSKLKPEELNFFERMNKFIVILAVLSCLAACHKVDEAVVSIGPGEALSVTDTVEMSRVKSTMPVLMPVRFIVTGKYLVLYQKNVDRIFQFYDLPLTGKSFSAGMIGRGPDEFINPDPGSMLGTKNGFCLADLDAYKTVEVIDRSIKIVSKEPLITGGVPHNGVVRIGDKFLNLDVSSMITTRPEDEAKQFQVIGESGVEKHICDVPDWDDNNANMIRYISHVVTNQERKVFAAFYCGFRKIRYYSYKGELLKEISVDFPDSSVHIEDGFYETYTRPVASLDRIVVRCGNYNRLVQDAIPNQTELQIWDWDGRLIHRLIVPMWLELYTIDFSTGFLYAAYSEFEDEIFYSDISEYL